MAVTPEAARHGGGADPADGSSGGEVAGEAAAAARLSAVETARWRRLAWMLAAMVGLVFVGRAAIKLQTGVGVDFDTAEGEADFLVFWGAAKLALAGDALSAFDPAALRDSFGGQDFGWWPWVYPPGFLLVLMPFGALPYGLAWAAFGALSLIALGLALRAVAPLGHTAWLLTLAAPAFLPALKLGQTSLLWAAALLAGMVALRQRRVLLAGLLLGALSLKPQLCIMVAVALIAAGEWRVILWGGATALVLLLVPTALFGTGYWPLLIETMQVHAAFVAAEAASIPLMASPFTALSALGVPAALALGLQWGAAAGMAVVLWFAWRRPGVSFDARMAALAGAIPLASPYLWWYDTALAALAALFLVRCGAIVPRGRGLLLLAPLWLGALPMSVADALMGKILFPRLYGASVVILAAVLGAAAVIAELRRARSPGPAT